jgi:hypothetical protein
MNIERVNTFRNVAAPGDMVIIFHADIPYSTYPATTATESIIFRLMSVDGSTPLSTARPYIFTYFENNGYGDIISGFYFSATDNLTWGNAYNINIVGLPVYYTGMTPTIYTMTSSDYNAENQSQENQRTAMKNYVLELCDTFKTIYPDWPLKSTSMEGIVLSQYGESYLIGAIPNIQAMCPSLFYLQVYIPETIPVQTYDMSVQEAINTGIAHTDLERGAKRIGEKIGVDAKFILAILVLAGALWAAVKIVQKGYGVEWAALIAAAITLGASLIVGDTIFVLVMIGGLAAIIGLAWILRGKTT